MARDFNGTSAYIRPSAELDIAGTALTISAWVWIDSTTADMMIVCKGDANAYNYNYFLSITGLGYLPTHAYPVFGYITGSLQHAVEAASTLSTGQWYHLCGVYNGATQKIYINAVEDASIAETGSMTQNNYAVEIGASPNISGNSMYLDGRVAEVGLWNVGLNADEIKALKNRLSPAFIRPESLLAYYPLIGESPEPDWKAANNGTVTNATVIEHIAITYPPVIDNPWFKIVAANVTVAPSPSTAAASVVAPTVVLGALTLAPTARTAAAAVVAPTVVLSSLTIAPNPATAAAASVAPTTVLGALTLTPAARTAAASVVAPTVMLGSLTVAPAVSTAAASVVAPTIVLGALTLTPAARTAAASVVAPTVVLGSLTVAPAVSTAAASVVAPTIVLGGLTLTPAARTAAASVVAPTVVLGSVSITPTPATAATSTLVGSVVGGGVSLTPSAAIAVASVVAPTVVMSSVIVAPTPSTAAAATVAPTVFGGGLSLTPAPASAAAASLAPTIILGSLVLAPSARTSAAVSTLGAVLISSLGFTPAAAFARAASLLGGVLIESPGVTPPTEPLVCYPPTEPLPARLSAGGLYARIGTVDVPILKASVTWKVSAVSEFTVSVPARSISRKDAYFADIQIWDGNEMIISGLVLDTPQIELDLQGVSTLSLRCVDEIGRLTTTRAIITKHVQDEWLPQVITDLLRVADWELGDYSTLLNTGVHVTVDLRNKETLFAQVVEVIKSVPKTVFRYSGINPLTGKRRLDIGYFNRDVDYLIQGDNLVSLKVNHNTAKLVRQLEAFSDALPDRRITLADALQYPTINNDPDFAQYPIMYDPLRGNYVMINQALTRGCDIAKSFSMHRTKNEGVPSAAEIAAAGYSVWQHGVRFMQQSDDYISASVTGLFEKLPTVGERMYVRGHASETVWDTGTLNYREIETFDLQENMRITQVSYDFEKVVTPGHVRHHPIYRRKCNLELTTSDYAEEFDDVQTVVETVQTFKQYDSPGSVKPAGALTYTTISLTAYATDATDLACDNMGKVYSFPVPSAPAGATSVLANIISVSHPSGSYRILQPAAFPATPLIVCGQVAGGWGLDNLTLTAQFIFS